MIYARIPWIRRIVLCSGVTRQEQVQELLQEYTTSSCGDGSSWSETKSDRIKYICASSANNMNGCGSNVNGCGGVLNQCHHQYHHHHHHHNHNGAENSFNRLVKSALQSLKRLHDAEPYDVVIVHDAHLPYVEESIVYELTIEALKHGAASLGTAEVINNNFLFRFDESSGDVAVENPENSPNFMKRGFLRSVSINASTLSDFLNTFNYRIGFKPQSFQYSIFEAVFDNVCTTPSSPSSPPPFLPLNNLKIYFVFISSVPLMNSTTMSTALFWPKSTRTLRPNLSLTKTL